MGDETSRGWRQRRRHGDASSSSSSGSSNAAAAAALQLQQQDQEKSECYPVEYRKVYGLGLGPSALDVAILYLTWCLGILLRLLERSQPRVLQLQLPSAAFLFFIVCVILAVFQTEMCRAKNMFESTPNKEE